MDSLSKVLKEIDALVAELKSLLPMKKEDEERLWRKFRLEWNYNSNHIEGNTLTYGQTELLLIFDKTTGDHDMREYEEMKAHDVAVQLVRHYAADSDRELTEADIREFNKIILVRPFWGNAQTPDGQPTRKQIVPGEYKREPNSVLLQNGEMFHYTSPEETPAKMQALVGWYRKASAEKKEHAVVIAAKLHYEFVRIHPFDDCNGRTSRLLMNYVLLRNGLPPVIIKTADKKGYLNALNKADVGDLNAFVEYVAKELKWSLSLSIKAAKNESVDEVDDLGKEITVWKRGLGKEPATKNVSQVLNTYSRNVGPILNTTLIKFLVLSDLFRESNYSSHYLVNGSDGGETINRSDGRFENKDWCELFGRRIEEIAIVSPEDFDTRTDGGLIKIKFHGYKHSSVRPFDFNLNVSFVFERASYSIFFDNVQFSARYNEGIDGERLSFTAEAKLKKVFEQLKTLTD